MTFAEFVSEYIWLIALAFLVLYILNKWYTAATRKWTETGDEDADTPAHYSRARVLFFMNLCLLAVILVISALLSK
jgi:hypothetical protein